MTFVYSQGGGIPECQTGAAHAIFIIFGVNKNMKQNREKFQGLEQTLLVGALDLIPSTSRSLGAPARGCSPEHHQCGPQTTTTNTKTAIQLQRAERGRTHPVSAPAASRRSFHPLVAGFLRPERA